MSADKSDVTMNHDETSLGQSGNAHSDETIEYYKSENAKLLSYIQKLKNAFHHTHAIQFEQESVLDQLVNDDSDIEVQQKTIEKLKRKIAQYEKQFGVLGDEFDDDDVEVLRLRKENLELIRSSKKKDEEIFELRNEIQRLKKTLSQPNNE